MGGCLLAGWRALALALWRSGGLEFWRWSCCCRSLGWECRWVFHVPRSIQCFSRSWWWPGVVQQQQAPGHALRRKCWQPAHERPCGAAPVLADRRDHLTAQHSTAQHSTAQHGTVQDCAIPTPGPYPYPYSSLARPAPRSLAGRLRDVGNHDLRSIAGCQLFDSACEYFLG